MTSGVINAMSIDVEDYFQVTAFDATVSRASWESMPSRVEANTLRLLTIFDEFKVRATFFVLGWVGQRFPNLVREIAGRGHEVASHGYAHRLVYDQTLHAFRDDIKRAKALLEDLAGRRVIGYRAPSYSITSRSLWALDVLLEEGYEYDASIFPIRHDRYGIPVSGRRPYKIRRRVGTLIEVPGSTARVGQLNLPIAGGGYFRVMPYWWTRWGISRINRREQLPAIFYLHPWEIDPDQPKLAAGRLTRARHYCNLGRTESRLRRLLTDFQFDAIETVVVAVGHDLPDNGLAIPLPYAW